MSKPVFFKVETLNPETEELVANPLVLNQSVEADRQRFRRHCDWALNNGHAIEATPVKV